ncbi:polyunsaturated fatty acid 5-lipoxygenase-like [Ptychodera flava]|uniref:polyunsaturated fatty acid 5-lipoxygenase-like n=1 Tax=Ptychodera flava TaxID=63121 RepID=UPI003969E6C8
MGSAVSSLLPDYVIYIKTGDVKGGGTDAAVHLILYNEDGKKSREILLSDPFGWNFERNQTDRFYIRNMHDLGEIAKIEVWRDVWFGDDWYLDSVIIEDWRRKDKYPFPVHRWVTDCHLLIEKYDCFLPMMEPNPVQRQEELDFNKRQYNFGPANQGAPIMVETLPKHEEFSFAHQMDLNKQLMQSILKTKVTFMMSKPWTTLDCLTNVYSEYFVLPESYATWKEDWHFGSQRLQGCNPCVIELCKEIPKKFAVTNEMVKPIMEDMTLEECIAQKRLFIVDYKRLKDLPTTTSKVVVCAPIALFFMNKEKVLMPVAIQLFQDAGPDNPVFLPTDPQYTWMLAKMFFNNADASVHESAVHLAFTHILIETFSLAVNRNLSPSHPIFRLLAPHLKYVMAINHSAVEILISPNGWIDRAMSVGRIGMLEIIRREWKNWRFDINGDLPTSLKARGVYDPEVIPDYPFRDDAMLIYDAIKNYVSAVVKGHYKTSEKVAEDIEIQNMAEELCSEPPEGLGVKGVPGDGSFTSWED